MLARLVPDARVVMIEPTAKKTSFLAAAARRCASATWSSTRAGSSRAG
ncbi:MAG: hypothetical protein U1F43_21000 [Myxococcota bacterium]